MASQDKVRSFRIVNGPSKFDLMLSLFDGNKMPRRTVKFLLEGIKQEVEVAIASVEQEDGSGESWNWAGNTRASTVRGYNVKGYFATRGRVGHLEFEVPYYSSWDQSKGGFEKVVSPTDERDLDLFISDLKS